MAPRNPHISAAIVKLRQASVKEIVSLASKWHKPKEARDRGGFPTPSVQEAAAGKQTVDKSEVPNVQESKRLQTFAALHEKRTGL